MFNFEFLVSTFVLITARLSLFVCLGMMFSSCSNSDKSILREVEAEPKIESMFSDIRRESCLKTIDKDDPNDTPYWVCSGILGYKLILRNAEGRQSIDVVTPAGERFELNYWDSVTKHFSHLGDKAQWRVLDSGAETIAIALIVSVNSREDVNSPEKVTHVYSAVAKITTESICTTHSILSSSVAAQKLRQTADSAREHDCIFSDN